MGDVVGEPEDEEVVADVVDAERVGVVLLLVLIEDVLLVLGTDVVNKDRSFC